MKKFTSACLTLFIVLIATSAFCVTVRDKMTYEGPVTFEGTVTTSGATSQTGAQTFANTVTLDDGSGASPSFVMTDATDESATFSKVDAGYVTVTTVAGDGVNVLTGNLKVGNGTPGVALGGEDAYVEGTFEVDGAVQLDGTLTFTGTLNANGNTVIGDAATDTVTIGATILGTSPLIFEGTTADDYEMTVQPEDVTADRTIKIPDLNGTVILSNGLPGELHSVKGVNSGFEIEGATANDYETTLTVTDPTADRTITFPDQTGTASINCTASHDYGAAAVDWTLTAAEAACSAISVTNANGAVNAILPAAVPGKLFTVINGSGQTLTFKVTGQTGGTVATAKWALYTTIAADAAEVYELP